MDTGLRRYDINTKWITPPSRGHKANPPSMKVDFYIPVISAYAGMTLSVSAKAFCPA